MPCDTPPPPPPLDEDDIIEEDPDDLMYEFVDEAEIEGDIPDDSVVTFQEHKESVFCCNFDKNAEFAVSGGQDDTAYVWSVATGEVLFVCHGHTESVVSVSFSPDAAYVATADMNGLVQMWDKAAKSKVWDFEAEAEITWMEWLHNSNILVAGTVDGTCWKWSIPGAFPLDVDTSMFQTSGFGCSAGCVSPNDEKLAAGYEDGTVKIWNISDCSLAGTILSGPTGHKDNVTTIRYHPDNSLILTGSVDGTVKLIKSSNCRVLWSINCCDVNHEHEDVSVESVAFCHSNSLIVTGTNCGLLSVWDVSTKTKRSCNEMESSVVKFIPDENHPMIYMGTADGKIQAVDVRTGYTTHTWLGHTAAILDITISKDQRFILTAADDATCKVFQKA